MIIRDGTNPKIEEIKETLGISGDVYIDDANHIESLYSHKRLLTENKYLSTATTIEEAEVERYAFEEEMERRRREQPEPDPEPDLTLDDTLEMLRELGVNVDDN
jgi:hypothetical protein